MQVNGNSSRGQGATFNSIMQRPKEKEHNIAAFF
jgi:hypothetical protein